MTSPAVTWLRDRQAEAIGFLEALVNQDSGTYDREDVNTLADMLAGPLRALGFVPTRFPQTTYGDHWLWERRGSGPKRLLCVSHIHASGVAPTIDGLGPQDSLAHNPDEYIELPTLIERARVNARFVELWAERFPGPRAG